MCGYICLRLFVLIFFQGNFPLFVTVVVKSIHKVKGGQKVTAYSCELMLQFVLYRVHVKWLQKESTHSSAISAETKLRFTSMKQKFVAKSTHDSELAGRSACSSQLKNQQSSVGVGKFADLAPQICIILENLSTLESSRKSWNMLKKYATVISV